MFSMKITARPYTTPGVKVRGDICLSGNTSGTNVPPLKATVLGNIYEVIFAKQGDYGFETDKRFVFPVNLFGTFMSTLKDRVKHSTWSIAEEISVALCCNEIPDRVDTVLFWLKFPWNRQS